MPISSQSRVTRWEMGLQNGTKQIQNNDIHFDKKFQIRRIASILANISEGRRVLANARTK